MARLQAKPLDNPDEVRSTQFGRVDIYNLDDLVIGRMVFEPGWHWMEHVRPIAGTSLCQYHHVGICISGRLGNRLEDGTTIEIGPGTTVGEPSRPTTVTAPSIRIAPEALVHGTISARESAEVGRGEAAG